MGKAYVIHLPEKVKNIIDTITKAGYEAYAVGGCIRDSILGREPDDWDITTSASPEQVKKLFKRTVDTGIAHGTVTVLSEGEGFEVTTYRIDGEYEDNRHPKEVIFTASLAEDLKRRDFTINAMAYNEKEGLVDLFHGREDMEQKIIRCVGNPEERFTEDALRLMRAVRFSAQLGYRIDEETKKAVRALSGSLTKISAERIQVELVKLVVSPHPDYLKIAYETGITRVILPEFDRCMETAQKNPHHCLNVGEHTLKAMQAARPHRMLRLALLFHDMGKPETLTEDEKGISHFYGHPAVSEEIAKKVLRRLKFDNETISTVSRLVKYHDYEVPAAPSSVRRAIMKTGEAIFPLLFEVKKADIEAQSDYLKAEKKKRLQAVYEVYQEILEKKQCVSLGTMAIGGRDLIETLGMKPGIGLGEMLRELLELVIDNPEKNNREALLKEAERILKNK